MKQKLLYKFPSCYIVFKSKTNLNTIRLNIKGLKRIKEKGLFDIGYYLRKNPDIIESGVDPLLHYMFYGFKESRDPNPSFDNDYYMSENPEIKDLDISPLVHYSVYGQKGNKINKNQKLKVMDINIINNPAYSHKIIEVTFNKPILASNEWIELFDYNKERVPIEVEFYKNRIYMVPIEPLSKSFYTLILHTKSITDHDGNPIHLYLRFLNVDKNLYVKKKDMWQ